MSYFFYTLFCKFRQPCFTLPIVRNIFNDVAMRVFMVNADLCLTQAPANPLRGKSNNRLLADPDLEIVVQKYLSN